MRKFLSYLKSKKNEEYNFFKELKTKTGIDFDEFYNLKFRNSLTETSLFGRKIQAPNAFWHLHSLNEVFVEEVYKFKPKSKSPIILDCGSNIGLSIIYFKKNYPESRIIGFEPDPDIFRMLEDNIRRFEFSNVQLINKAVWKEEGELTFNSIGALGGTLDLEDKNAKSGDLINNKVVVKTARLKNFLVNERIDFLKIDVEGAEFEILDDCLDELDNVENLFIEYHRPRGSTLRVGSFIDKLENSGFKIYIKEAWNNLPHPFCSDDYNPMYDLQLNIFCFRK